MNDKGVGVSVEGLMSRDVVSKSRYRKGTLDIEAHRYDTRCKDHTVLLATHAFINRWKKPYLPLSSQPKLVFISHFNLPTLKGWKAELA